MHFISYHLKATNKIIASHFIFVNVFLYTSKEALCPLCVKTCVLSSYIFYFRQNGHKVNNKCGTSCGQCGLRGQREWSFVIALFLYIFPILFLLLPTELNFLDYIYFYKHIIFCASCSNFFSLYFVMVKKWITGTFPIFLLIYFSKLFITF